MPSKHSHAAIKRSLTFVLCLLLAVNVFGCRRANPAAAETSETAKTTEPLSTSAPTSPPAPDEATLLLEQVQKEADALRTSILNSKTTLTKADTFTEGETYTGTAYYVSSMGDDALDGLSPESAWATMERVSGAALKRGDAVFFERGGTWHGQLFGRDGVTYSAYGEGEKPRFYGTSREANDPADWSLLAGTENIWVYRDTVPDCGCIVFNEGESNGIRVTPWYLNGQWVPANTQDRVFDVAKDLTADLSFYSATEMFSTVPLTGREVPADLRPLYLRCDAGNPAEVFSSVRFMLLGDTIVPGKDNVFDNLAILYCGSHGIFNWGSRLVVQNCELGWIGGCIHYYVDGKEPMRFGNGVENDGSYDLYIVRGCYIHDIYDAGASNQGDGRMENITYTGNLIERCDYGIEVFCWTEADGDGNKNLYKNLLIENNYILYSGYGWCVQRPVNNWDAAIMGHDAMTPSENYVIRNNVLCLAKTSLLVIGQMPEGEPTLDGNTYIQRENAPMLFKWKMLAYRAGWEPGQAALLELDPAGKIAIGPLTVNK